MKTLTESDGQSLTEELLNWFAANRRPLPWRERYDPYEVWISEIMLQQTQMERGVEYFRRWMDRFPSVEAVAAAPEEDILHAWEGLGYYRRARFLHAAAKVMAERHGGRVPDDQASLEALPGLGTYTVAAIRGIAHNQDVPTIDANVERVFSRILDLDVPPRKKEAAAIIRETATRLLPSGRARDYNQALMEFGALVCGKAPRCGQCPVIQHCESRRQGVERERPVLEAKAAIVPVVSGHGLLIVENRVLVVKRPDGGLWGGLWEFPGAVAEAGETPEQAALRVFRELGIPVTTRAALGVVRHSYTNHRLTAHFFRLSTERSREADDLLEGACPQKSGASPAAQVRFIDCRETGTLAMPAHHRKLADRYFSGRKRRGDAPEQGTL